MWVLFSDRDTPLTIRAIHVEENIVEAAYVEILRLYKTVSQFIGWAKAHESGLTVRISKEAFIQGWMLPLNGCKPVYEDKNHWVLDYACHADICAIVDNIQWCVNNYREE